MNEINFLQNQKATIKLAKKSIWIGLVLLTLLSSIKIVEAGTVRVVTRFGRVINRTLSPGFNVVIPFVDRAKTINTKFLLYETMAEENFKRSESDYKDSWVDTNTKDGQPVDVFYTIRFSIDPTRAGDVINRFGSEDLLVDKAVRAKSRSSFRIKPSDFTAEELYIGEGKEKLASVVDDDIRKELEGKGIILDTVLIREIKFTKEYTDAIEAKQRAAVQIETEKNIASQEEHRAKARIIKATAEAEEQRLQQTTLSPQVLEKFALDNQKAWIEAWSGNPPTYYLGDGGNNLLFQIPGK